MSNASSPDRALALATLAIHGGQSPDPSTGAVMPPIYATSTYAQSSPGEHQGFEYSRTHNPTRFAYERCVASLEGGTRGFAFASGMAASSTVIELLDAGSHVVAMDAIYGGIVSIVLKGGFEAAKRFCEKTELFTLAESLGGVESLVNHPAVMTHASIPVARREQLGISDALVRLSVGVEELGDLQVDLERALQ